MTQLDALLLLQVHLLGSLNLLPALDILRLHLHLQHAVILLDFKDAFLHEAVLVGVVLLDEVFYFYEVVRQQLEALILRVDVVQILYLRPRILSVLLIDLLQNHEQVCPHESI